VGKFKKEIEENETCASSELGLEEQSIYKFVNQNPKRHEESGRSADAPQLTLLIDVTK
jgi:hypothetical protein